MFSLISVIVKSKTDLLNSDDLYQFEEIICIWAPKGKLLKVQYRKNAFTDQLFLQNNEKFNKHEIKIDTKNIKKI